MEGFILWKDSSYRGLYGVGSSVCVPTSAVTVSFFPQEHPEDVESKEASEEAEDDKGRP